ncbi:nucleotidyltransferase domain-containing protein [Candidatus Woesearchaeota archaeon]|nr:nucleotidyltransferase domain-containing protein [Candidatus Woesearchaeota archaeon]
MDNLLKIINYLGKNHQQSFTQHQLSNLLNIPYATFYRTVQAIGHLLVTKVIGKSKTIQINFNNSVIKSYLAIASDEEGREYFKKQPIINKISTELNTKEIVLLFGSYAKKTATEKSDIDIIIINKYGKKSISFSKYELLFKKKINPIFVTEKEFITMLKDKEENIGKQALKNHIVLNSPEEFWRCVLHGI